MPGTGKTHLIVLLLRILIARKDKILLTGYTHFSVDNILTRFAQKYPSLRHKILRVGDAKQVDSAIQDLVYNKERLDDDEEAHDICKNKNIIAATCLGTANGLFKDLSFDTCIIDEASQVLEPVALGPILLAQRFILIGDHYQLPPLIKSGKAKEAGMGVSLFERLAKEHKKAVSMLTIQYRMNKDIMRFSNKVIYAENPMKCANSAVENGRIIGLNQNVSDKKWIKDIIKPDTTVAFLDLDGVKILHDENRKNLNCELTVFVVEKLVQSGMRPQDIGVITPLNDDVNRVKSRLKRFGVSSYTIDKCQGIDKRCIIINFSMNKSRTRGLLSDRRRINVAFTRAKHKLIMIGSYANLKDLEAIGSFVKQLSSENKIKMDETRIREVTN